MDKKAEQIRDKIKRLNLQLQKHEERHEKSIIKLIRDTSRKGIDIRVLAGILVNAENIMKTNQKEVEAWQAAGEKFLFKPKNKTVKPKDKTTRK